jgi:hypothetical protein
MKKRPVEDDQEGLFQLVIQLLRTFFYSAIWNTHLYVLLVHLTDIGRNITATEVTTPVVPFKNKIQYYQRKQSFLITSYFVKMENCIHIFKSTEVVLSCDRTTKKSYKK